MYIVGKKLDLGKSGAKLSLACGTRISMIEFGLEMTSWRHASISLNSGTFVRTLHSNNKLEIDCSRTNKLPNDQSVT